MVFALMGNSHVGGAPAVIVAVAGALGAGACAGVSSTPGPSLGR